MRENFLFRGALSPMFSDPASCLSSSPSRVVLLPVSPYTYPLRTATTPKRPFQGSTGSSPSRRPPPLPSLLTILFIRVQQWPYNFFKLSRQTCMQILICSGSLNCFYSSDSLESSLLFHLTPLKRSSLRLEKRLVSQKILEHDISLSSQRADA